MEEKNSRSSQKKAEKRQMILEAACRIFSEKGYHNARVEEIALEAGVGKGTVYEYFPSKKYLFQQVVDMHYDDLYKGMNDYLGKKRGDLKENFRYLLRNHVRICQKNRELTFFILRECAVMDEDLRVWFAEKQKKREEATRKQITRMLQRYQIEQVNEEAFSIQLSGVLMALQFSIVVGSYQGDDEQIIESLSEMLARGIMLP